MVLQDVKRTLRAQRRMTLSQLSAEIGSDRTTVAGALQFFVDRGNVYRELESGSGVTCGTTCRSCPLGDACLSGTSKLNGLEVFVWNEEEQDER
jgi:hypothetical protein